MSAHGRVRIGELSRRTGVSIDALRIWERRYGLLRPERTDGGQRLYAPEDEGRVRRMQLYLREGLPASEAARMVVTTPAEATDALARPLVSALENLDDVGAHAALDRLFSQLGVETAVADVVIPYLRDLGERWACAEITVAHEHFASRLLHGRLLGAARGWDSGRGPRALLACPPLEEHDLGLISFGIALRARGWRITYLGASTPIRAMLDLVSALDFRIAVLSAVTPTRFAESLDGLRDLAGAVPLALGGAGANARLAADIGARALSGDPVAAADDVAQTA